jgi:light-harvesting protein B-800-850 alpha chain
MIYGKIWCVVKPTVGIPLFLGAVAVSSFTVHYMLLTHTTWLPQYFNGKAATTAAAPAPGALATAPPGEVVASVTPAPKQ